MDLAVVPVLALVKFRRQLGGQGARTQLENLLLTAGTERVDTCTLPVCRLRLGTSCAETLGALCLTGWQTGRQAGGQARRAGRQATGQAGRQGGKRNAGAHIPI